MQFLALAGSLRAASTNTELLRGLQRHAPEAHSVTRFEEMASLPLFNLDLEYAAPPVRRLAAEVEKADGLLISCPDYAHGIPGAMKNNLDWLVSRFQIPHKPVMLVHASTRSAYVREHLREVLKTMSCRLYPEAELQLHLIGQQPGEVRMLLDLAESRQAMRAALESFARFVHEAG